MADPVVATAIQIKYKLPASNRSAGRQRHGILIKAGLLRLQRQTVQLSSIRSQYTQVKRPGWQLLAVCIAQQDIEQNGFAGTVQITRTEYKQLHGLMWCATDIGNFAQIQRTALQR